MGNTLLPEDARQILMKAASTPVTKYDPLARIKAIEKAERRIRSMYPYLFRESDDEQN
jgi:hypothetical protein